MVSTIDVTAHAPSKNLNSVFRQLKRWVWNLLVIWGFSLWFHGGGVRSRLRVEKEGRWNLSYRLCIHFTGFSCGLIRWFQPFYHINTDGRIFSFRLINRSSCNGLFLLSSTTPTTYIISQISFFVPAQKERGRYFWVLMSGILFKHFFIGE